MVQVENEIGMFEDARDHSPLAEKAYQTPVPNELLSALKLKQKGTWAQVFGTDSYADEKFMAYYYYARYVERLARSARRIHNIPLCECSNEQSRAQTGAISVGGPLAHLAEIWRRAAPDIDIPPRHFMIQDSRVGHRSMP